MIWDNAKEKIVAYGKLSKQMKLFGYPNKGAYLHILDYFSQSIIEQSPIALKIASSY